MPMLSTTFSRHSFTTKYIVLTGLLMNKAVLTSGGNFSSFYCIDGTQKMSNKPLIQLSSKFPVNDPQIRTCLFRDVCFIDGELKYFQDPSAYTKVPKDFLFEGFGNELFYTGAGQTFTTVFQQIIGAIPSDIAYDQAEVAFLDAHSNAYNYGHYMIDNVIPHYVAARIFNLPFTSSRQVFDSSCKRFGIQGEHIAHQLIPFNHSLGSFREACLDRITGMWPYVFNYAPIFLEGLYSGPTCFKNLLAGQGSTFGLNSEDFARAITYREFRHLVTSRIGSFPKQESIVLVAIRSAGHSSEETMQAGVHNLCATVKEGVKGLDGYIVNCFVPEHVTFEEEIKLVHSAKILVSLHGTVSYISLFAREGTQQIVLHDPSRAKEHQTLQWVTHINVYFLPWTRVGKDLPGLLYHAMTMHASFVEHKGTSCADCATMETESSTAAKKVKALHSSIYGRIPIRDGTFVKKYHSQGFDSTYFVVNGTRRLIPNIETFMSLKTWTKSKGPCIDAIWPLIDGEFYAMKEGPPMPSHDAPDRGILRDLERYSWPSRVDGC